MKHSFLTFGLLMVAFSSGQASMDLAAKRLMPDTIVMNDGTEHHGLIIKNDAEKVILQERLGEVEIPKAYIRRIQDQGEAGVYFADIIDPGKLPPWRMIVQDLRSDDNIHSFRQIPATTIETGYIRNIPYLSFRINKHTEMNVYGNPENPVCLEFGVYEHGEQITQFKKIIRAYFAGFLNSRAQIAALYELKESGDELQAGKLRLKVLPPSAPDAYGGWWISIYDPKRLDKARLSDAAYKKETLLFTEVNSKSGQLRDDRSLLNNKFFTEKLSAWHGMMPGLQGFYRDKLGELKLQILDANTKPTSPSGQ